MITLPKRGFSRREIEVMRLVAQGLSNEQIGESLCLAENTIRTHISTISAKTGLRRRTQIAIYAIQAGFIGLNDIELPGKQGGQP